MNFVLCYNAFMSEQTLQYSKTYSIDILDRAGDGNNIIVYFFMAELTYVKVPDGVTLVMIYPYDWSHTMTPWEYNAGKELERTGGGAEFATKFFDEIVTPTESKLPHTYKKRYIAGYSLGGLMAAYFATVLDGFDGFASCSGSFWYPKASEYFREHPYKIGIQACYYSLGNKEALTMHPLRCEVEDKTRVILADTKLQGIEKTTLEINEGGHFTRVAERVEKALLWLTNC